MKTESKTQSSASCSSTSRCEAKPPTGRLWRTQSVKKPQSIQRETRSPRHISTPQVASNSSGWAGPDIPFTKLPWESAHLSSYPVIYCHTLGTRPSSLDVVHSTGHPLDTLLFLIKQTDQVCQERPCKMHLYACNTYILYTHTHIPVCIHIYVYASHTQILLPVVCGQWVYYPFPPSLTPC